MTKITQIEITAPGLKKGQTPGWILLHPKATWDMLGFIPAIISLEDKRPVQDQVNDRYAHGGGWKSFNHFTLIGSPDQPDQYKLSYPNDPLIPALAKLDLPGNIEVVLFNHAWVGIIKEGKLLDVARLD